MATLNTTAIAGASAYTAGPAGNLKTAYASFAFTAALVNLDVINMVRVPAGAIITGVALKTSDLDTNGAPTITLNVGDTGDIDRLLAAVTIGQAGGTSTALVSSTGQFYEYTTETIISVQIPTGPATSATSGTIELSVEYLVGI